MTLIYIYDDGDGDGREQQGNEARDEAQNNEEAHVTADTQNVDYNSDEYEDVPDVEKNFLSAPAHDPRWKEIHEQDVADRGAQPQADLRKERLDRYVTRRANALENHGSYVEDLEEVPHPSEEQGASSKEPGEEEGARTEEEGAHGGEGDEVADDDQENEEDDDPLNTTSTSSMIYERDGVDFSLAHVEEKRFESARYPLMTPRLVDRYALPKFLDNAYKADDKHWWHMVPNRMFTSAKTARYMNAILGGGEFHHILMNQMTAKQGIKKHGEVAVAALMKELSHNLIDKDVIEGKKFHELTNNRE